MDREKRWVIFSKIFLKSNLDYIEGYAFLSIRTLKFNFVIFPFSFFFFGMRNDGVFYLKKNKLIYCETRSRIEYTDSFDSLQKNDILIEIFLEFR